MLVVIAQTIFKSAALVIIAFFIGRSNIIGRFKEIGFRRLNAHFVVIRQALQYDFAICNFALHILVNFTIHRNLTIHSFPS